VAPYARGGAEVPRGNFLKILLLMLSELETEGAMTGGWGQFERRTALIFAISLLVIGGTLACIGSRDSRFGLWFLIGMEISVVCHELGHALFAVLGSMEVHSIVFGGGPLLWHRRFGETRVEWRVLPCTGYVTASPILTRQWYWPALVALGGVFGNMAVIGLLAALDALKTVSDAAGGGIVMAQALTIFGCLIPFSMTLNGIRVESDGRQLLKILWRRRPFDLAGFRAFCYVLLSVRRRSRACRMWGWKPGSRRFRLRAAEGCRKDAGNSDVGRARSGILSNQLLAQITPEQQAEWKQGTYDDWATEAFNIAYDDLYGDPPLSGSAHLDAAYVARAEKDVALQLNRTGVRLAAVLNKALGRQVADDPQR
jgi:hypothetical protein